MALKNFRLISFPLCKVIAIDIMDSVSLIVIIIIEYFVHGVIALRWIRHTRWHTTGG